MYKKNLDESISDILFNWIFFLYLSSFLRIKIFNTNSHGTWCIPFSHRDLEYIMQYLKTKKIDKNITIQWIVDNTLRVQQLVVGTWYYILNGFQIAVHCSDHNASEVGIEKVTHLKKKYDNSLTHSKYNFLIDHFFITIIDSALRPVHCLGLKWQTQIFLLT